MRSFVRRAAFDLACNMFTSFGYFKDEEDNLKVLRNIYESLKESGVLVIEVLGKERLARTWLNTISSQLADGTRA
jgi:SAM-dependent methyltransferase